ETKCPELERWDQCTAHCQENCSNYYQHIPCPLICVSGCICEEGFVRERDGGKCIPIDKCSKHESP
ncbi:hypothetical protein NPIL_587541, partial [Nephila pilipes]